MACGCSCGHRTGCGSCCDAWSKLPGANSADFTLADATIALDKRYDGRYLQLVGGTLTGPLVLDGTAPVNPQDATDKSYVDGKLTSLLTLMPSVATQADLPSGDAKGSVRTVLTDGTMWLYDGVSWQSIGKASTPIPTGTKTGDTLFWDGATWQARVPSNGVPNGVNDLDTLSWDTATQSWVTSADEFGDETNVTVAADGSSDGGVPVYRDADNTWDVRKIEMEDIAEAANANDGEFLKYDAANGWTLSVEAPALPNGTLAGDQLAWDAAQSQWAAGRPAVPVTPVANAAALPANPADGALAVTRDDNSLYIASGGNWVKVKVDLVQNGLTPASTTKAPSVDSVVAALSGKEPNLPAHNSPGDDGKLLAHTAGGLAWVAPIAPATNTLTPVASTAALPTTGNNPGDVRVTSNDGHLHIWAGNPGAWSDIGPAAGNSLPGGGSPGNWLTANAAGNPVWAPVAQNSLTPASAQVPPTVDAVNAALTRQGVPAATVADKDKVLTVSAAGAPTWTQLTTGSVGEISMFTKWAVPDGWLLCDGSQFSSTTYPELYAFLGTDRTPDLRGKFIRGALTGRNPLSTEGQATARPTTPFTTDTQGNHNHTIRIGGGGMVDGWYTQPGSYPSADSNWAAGNPSKDLAGSPMQGAAGNHSHTITGGGDSETRPANVALVYAIRSKPIKGAKGDSAALPTGTAGQVLAWDVVTLSWQPSAPVASATELKPPVASAANLPLTGNAVGDIRVTIDDGHMHVWTSGVGGAGQWDNIGPTAVSTLPADPSGQPYVAPARSQQLLAVYIRSEAFPPAGSGAEFISADAVTAGKTLGVGRWDLNRPISRGQWTAFWTTAGYGAEYQGDVTIKVDNADDPTALDIVITPPAGVTFQAPQADLSYHLAVPSSVNNDRTDSPGDANARAALVVTQDAQGAYHLTGGGGLPAFAFAAGAAGVVLLIPVDAPQPLGATITGGGTGPDLLAPAPAGDPGAAAIVWPGTRIVPPSGDQKVGRFASGDFVLSDRVGGVPRWDKLVVPPTQGAANALLRLDGSGGYKVGPAMDDLTAGMAVSDGTKVSWSPVPYTKAEVDTRVAPLRQIQEDLKHVPIMFKGTGPITLADIADPAKNYGMPAGTVPDPKVHHPESGDEYVDTGTQLAYSFTGHSSVSSLIRSWTTDLPAGFTLATVARGGFDLVQAATPVPTVFYLHTSGTYVAGDTLTLTTLKDNVAMTYTLKASDIVGTQVQFPAGLLAAVHAAFDAKWTITPQGQYGLKFEAKDVSENQVNGAGMVANITGKWLGNYLLSAQIGGSNNEHDKDIPPWGPDAATRGGVPDRTIKATVSAPLTITHTAAGRAHIDIPVTADLSAPITLSIPGSPDNTKTAPGSLGAYVEHKAAAVVGDAMVYQGNAVWVPEKVITLTQLKNIATNAADPAALLAALKAL